jgi:AcrR family transcriptional regulator
VVTAVDGSPLSAKQLERRQWVIRAALLLAAEGGYDAVHMRDVAAGSGVALGTIYRYFSSKDDLLAAALSVWTAELRERVVRQPARGDTPTEQVVDVLRRACRGIERHPTLTSALMRALGASDPGVSTSTREVGEHVHGITAPLLGHLPGPELEDVVAVLQHVWYSTLISWANGRRDVRSIGDELERAARLLLAPHEAPTGGPNGQIARSRPSQ